MNASEILKKLLTVFSESIPQADFFAAYSGKAGSRAPHKPTVTGEVLLETIKPSSQQAKLGFRIYLPPHSPAQTAEELFLQMCRLCSGEYPGFSAISRESAEIDSTTGLLTVLCTLTFTEETLTQGAGVSTVTIGGKEYAISGVTTTIQYDEEALTAIGEDDPFAVLSENASYTVTLGGIVTQGLSKVAGFTAVIGDTTYTGCRWRVISDALQKAEFVSEHREVTA